jgi:hypothetical protein
MKKDLFLFIDYANDSTKRVLAWTLKDLIAQVLHLDEDGNEVRRELKGLSQYEYNTWVNKASGYCIVLLNK